MAGPALDALMAFKKDGKQPTEVDPDESKVFTPETAKAEYESARISTEIVPRQQAWRLPAAAEPLGWRYRACAGEGGYAKGTRIGFSRSEA